MAKLGTKTPPAKGKGGGIAEKKTLPVPNKSQPVAKGKEKAKK